MGVIVQENMRSRYRSTWSAALLCLILGVALPSFAGLGGSVSSVQDDQVHMKAKLKVISGDAYAVHQITLPTGTVVREYVSPGGMVFGVSWHGPFIPDMKQLLDSYFDQYVTAAKAFRESHVGRVPLNIQQPSMVIQTGGHMRAFFGRAFNPELLPAGVTANDIR